MTTAETTRTSTSTATTIANSTGSGGDDLAAMTFEQLVSELESVATAMDRGDIGIEAAADLYARAGALHRAATERLAQVRVRLDALRGDAGS